MESRSKKSGRTPKKSSAKAKGKKKTVEKDSEAPTEKVSLLRSCINDPQTSILAPNVEDDVELKLRCNLFNKLIDHHYSEDIDGGINTETYPILDQIDSATEIEIPQEINLHFKEGIIPEKYQNFLVISDKKYYLNDHPVNRYQSINNLLRYFILHHLNKLKFDIVHDQALDILTDVTKAYIERIGFLANSYASVPGTVSNSIDIIKKTFLEIYPNGIDAIREYMNSLKAGDKMEIESTTDVQTSSVKSSKDELDEESLYLLKRELFLMKSPFVKRKKQSYSALYKDAFRTTAPNILSAQSRANPMNRAMTPGMKTFESPYSKYSTPQPTDKRKKGSDFEYDDEDLSSSSRLRRTRSRVNYSEEYDDEDYGDDLDDEGPKKKKRKSSKRKDV